MSSTSPPRSLSTSSPTATSLSPLSLGFSWSVYSSFSFHQCFLLSSILYLFIYFFPLHILFIFKPVWITFLNCFLLFQRILNKVLYIYIYYRFLVSMSVDYYFLKLEVTYKTVEDKLWVFDVWKSWSSSKSIKVYKVKSVLEN